MSLCFNSIEYIIVTSLETSYRLKEKNLNIKKTQIVMVVLPISIFKRLFPKTIKEELATKTIRGIQCNNKN